MGALEMTLLYDYYGDLLSQRQRDCFDMHYNQDMSLGEIAEELGISRQGIHDNISRAEDFLLRAEAAIGCMRRAECVRGAVAQLRQIAAVLEENSDPSVCDSAEQIRSVLSSLEE